MYTYLNFRNLIFHLYSFNSSNLFSQIIPTHESPSVLVIIFFFSPETTYFLFFSIFSGHFLKVYIKLLSYILPNNFIVSKNELISFSCGLNLIKIFLFDLHFITFLFIIFIWPILFSIFIQLL